MQKDILSEAMREVRRAEIKRITFEVAQESFDENDPVPFGLDPVTYRLGSMCMAAYEVYYDLIQDETITHDDIILWVSEAIAEASHDGCHGIRGNVN